MVNEEEVSEFVLLVNIVKSKNDFIFDSAYTHHMTPNRKFFFNYDAIDGEPILMGHDSL